MREILDKQKHWFGFGFGVTHYIDNPNIDYSSEETQLTIIDFNEKIEKCYQCD